MNRVRCRLCGKSLVEASLRGIYLNRANPKEEVPALWECSPNCDHTGGDQESALIGAIEDERPEQE